MGPPVLGWLGVSGWMDAVSDNVATCLNLSLGTDAIKTRWDVIVICNARIVVYAQQRNAIPSVSLFAFLKCRRSGDLSCLVSYSQRSRLASARGGRSGLVSLPQDIRYVIFIHASEGQFIERVIHLTLGTYLTYPMWPDSIQTPQTPKTKRRIA